MKGFVFAALVAGLVCYSGVARADFYKVTQLRRVESNTYSFRSGTAEGIIVTKYCYEYSFYDDAILKYDRYSYDNKLIFSSGTACDVAGVYLK